MTRTCRGCGARFEAAKITPFCPRCRPVPFPPDPVKL